VNRKTGKMVAAAAVGRGGEAMNEVEESQVAGSIQKIDSTRISEKHRKLWQVA